MIAEQKRALRQRLASLRNAIPPAERAALSERIARHVLEGWQAGTFAWQTSSATASAPVPGSGPVQGSRGADEPAGGPQMHIQMKPRQLACYIPFRSETDVMPVVRWCWAQRIPVAAPRVDAAAAHARAMTLHNVAGEQDLQPGAFGIREPVPHAPQAALQPGTLMLVPGLAFDAAGRRLGYGGGYYDSLLAKHRAAVASGAMILAAPIFAAQLVRAVPDEPHDVRVRFLITEDGIIDCANKKGESLHGHDAF